MSLFDRLVDLVRSGCPWVIGGDEHTGLFGYDEYAERVPHSSAQCGADEPASGSHVNESWRVGNPGAGTQNPTNRPRLVGPSGPDLENACPAAQGNHGSGEPVAGVRSPIDGSVAFTPATGTPNETV